MSKDYELYRALSMAHSDAKAQAAYHTAQLDHKPLFGWSKEKHDAYHIEAARKANMAALWLFVRMMQINPD